MQHDGFYPGSAQDWIRHARSDLAVASQPKNPDILPETLAFHAQQTVEKSIKAVLLHNGIKFPYTHNIAKLITIVIEAGIIWPEELNQASKLTEYAVETRYPGPVDIITDEEYQQTLTIAEKVLIWAECNIAGKKLE